MSFNLLGIPIIRVEADRECELCHNVAETRPYGPHGERICFACGQKDPDTTNRMMNKILFGDTSGETDTEQNGPSYGQQRQAQTQAEGGHEGGQTSAE